MVQPGQFSERPTLIHLGKHKKVLEGLWHRGDKLPGCLVLPPPPNDGGGMDHVVAAELVWALSRAGHPTLRFNFRGVGASQGERGSEEAQLEDARAALGLLTENTDSKQTLVIALAGSEGHALALAKGKNPPVGVALINPKRLPGPLPNDVEVWAVLAEHAMDSRAAVGLLPAQNGLSTTVIPGADAAFRKNLSEVGRLAVQWAQRHTPTPA